jgi:hypothetical protein
VHVFQRRTLVRKWHEDFSAIQTEGGLPGSESAGIVAFMRERLVDLGEDPRSVEEKEDLEATTSTKPRWDGEALSSAAALHHPQQDGKADLLDEIPLLNIDPALSDLPVLESPRRG